MKHEKIVILDFGSQYTQLIARRVRELNIYCEIYPFNKIPKIDDSWKAVILSGSPHSVREEHAPIPDLFEIKGKLPLLGVCYGAQHLAHHFGGEVLPSNTREYGRANLSFIDSSSALLDNVSNNSQVWMSHGDTIVSLPKNYKIIASTNDVEVAAYKIKDEPTYALQFHPEVYHSKDGAIILKNFLVNICNCKQDWTSVSFVDETIAEIKEKLGNDKVILGLSGGVDSTVAGVLLHKAIGENLYCIFVDNGLLRKEEFESVLQQYKGMGLNVRGVDAKDRFYNVLSGVSDPEKKRKIIGNKFIDVFDDEAHKIKDVKWLAQGTIYPDVIESISATGGPSATIKSHHNVGGLPDFIKLKIVEPLNSLFKDEKVRILQEADYIFTSSLKESGLYNKVWQAGTMLLSVKTVGVMGDERTYENVVALRAVDSTDGMTADWVHFPNKFLAKVSNEIINKVKGINRVVYDISSKPPATIEWE